MTDHALPELWRTLARYNRWMNGQLYGAAATLTDSERKRDLGAFFHSLHGTLNHLLLTDRVWLGRLGGEPFPVTGLDQELYGDFDELWRERQRTDGDIEALVAGFGALDLDRVVRYRRRSGGEAKARPLTVVMTHLFNHQTHHRGQATVLLGQLGRDYGVTDLIALPD